MCLIVDTTKNNISNPLLVNEDIYTLKLARNITDIKCESYYVSHKQYYHNLYKSKFSISIDYFNITRVYKINKGLHSLISSDYIRLHIHDISYNTGIILCKIPKGSKYYIGTRGDIVSNKLILIEPIIISDDTKFEFKNSSCIHKTNSTYLFNIAVKICKSYGIKIGL